MGASRGRPVERFGELVRAHGVSQERCCPGGAPSARIIALSRGMISLQTAGGAGKRRVLGHGRRDGRQEMTADRATQPGTPWRHQNGICFSGPAPEGWTAVWLAKALKDELAHALGGILGDRQALVAPTNSAHHLRTNGGAWKEQALGRQARRQRAEARPKPVREGSVRSLRSD